MWNPTSFWYDFGVRVHVMKILRVENRHNMAPFFWFVLSPCTSLSTILRGWQNIPGIYHPPSNSGKWSFIYWFPTANAIILVVTGILASWLGVDRSNLILVPWILTSWDPGHQQCHWRPPKGAVFDVCFCWSGFFPQKKHGRRHRWLEKLEKNTSPKLWNMVIYYGRIRGKKSV